MQRKKKDFVDAGYLKSRSWGIGAREARMFDSALVSIEPR